jgi:tRNA 2-thiouridine synthesizing protein D
MAKFTLVLTSSPYNSQNAYNALRFILASLAEDHVVRLFLLGDGVYLAQKDQKGQTYQLEKMLRECIEFGCNVMACGVCCDERGVTLENMVENVKIASMTDLVGWVTDSDSVLNF